MAIPDCLLGAFDFFLGIAVGAPIGIAAAVIYGLSLLLSRGKVKADVQ